MDSFLSHLIGKYAIALYFLFELLAFRDGMRRYKMGGVSLGQRRNSALFGFSIAGYFPSGPYECTNFIRPLLGIPAQHSAIRVSACLLGEKVCGDEICTWRMVAAILHIES